MSWKTAAEAAGVAAARGGRLTLALRLTMFYTAALTGVLVAASLLVYFAVANYLEEDDDQRLETKLREVRAIIERGGGQMAQDLRQAVGVEYVAESLEPFLIRIKDSANRVVVQTPHMETLLPVGVFDAAEAAIRDNGHTPYRLVAPGGHIFRARRMAAQTPQGESYQIHGAVDHEPETNLLARYRRTLWMVNAAALLVSAGLGGSIARRGLRPLEQMGQAVARISATTLDQRLPDRTYPGELAALARRFNVMLQGLQDAFDRLSRYSADIAHELRTPINNLRGEAEVALGRARTADEYREVLGSSLEECQRLSALIDSLLFIARAENPALQVHREMVNLYTEFEDIVDFYSVLAAEAGVEIRFEAPPQLLWSLDKHLFRRAVGNLVENALKYSRSGGHIHLRARADDARLWVSVADSGVGIPPQHLPHIFDRFYRVDADRAKTSGGTGLGLAIVKTIATLHGGQVTIESRPNEGTTATLILPVGPADAKTPAARPPRSDTPKA
jgi:two-component system heavy metal sensor histidine kinase CusS